MTTEDNFDLILWGATGFTGRLVAAELLKHGEGRRWALGGRNLSKLEALRAELAVLDPGAAELPIVVGDSLDLDSMRRVVASTRVVCTTVGPYSIHGMPLVQACVEAGVDCCDLSGEVPWMREVIDRFHDAAQQSGARIVHCCGFDSVPSDLGVLALHQAMAAAGFQLAEARFRVRSLRGAASGGTVASLVEVVGSAARSPEVRKILGHPYALNPPGTRRGPDRNDPMKPVFDADRRRWTGPFLMAGINTRVVRRTNTLLGFPYGEEFSYGEAVDTGAGWLGWCRAAFLSIGLGALSVGVAWAPTRALLRRFVLPAPGEGPTEKQRQNGSFVIDIFGVGGTKRLEGEARVPELGRARVRVAMDLDPGYAGTARMLAQCALALVESRCSGVVEVVGGVLTPASALGAPLIDRLRAVGLRIESTVTS